MMLPMSLLLGCGHPEADALEEASSLAKTEQPAAAIAKYEDIASTWPAAPEAEVAKARIPELHLAIVDADIRDQKFIEAGKYAWALKSGPYVDAVWQHVTRRADESPEFKNALVWNVDTLSTEDRAVLALSFVADAPYMSDAVKPWLAENLPTVMKEECTDKIAALDHVDDLEVLDAIVAACEVLSTNSPESDAGKAARAAINAGIPARREKIKASPAYKTEQALATCREYKSWVLDMRSTMRRLARQGNEDAFLKYKDRSEDEIERRSKVLMPAIDYLKGRVDALPDRGSKINLMERMNQDCQV